MKIAALTILVASCTEEGVPDGPVLTGDEYTIQSANDEMCFFWAYYYPSRGARMCVHSAAVGGPEGIDVCCPAAPGDQLSKFVCDDLGKQ